MSAYREAVERVVRAALAEDAPWGDVTSEHLIPAEADATASIVARESGVFAGGAAVEAAFEQVDERIRITDLVDDGSAFGTGAVLARIEGPARGVLRGERIALNLAQRLSGVATLTARYVAAVEGSGVRIVDTRKTTPGLRMLERYAVRAGGGRNHRFSLSDAVMAKDNHLAVLAAQGIGTAEALRRLRSSLPHTTHIEVEVDRVEQIHEALEGGADTIMLDNFALDDLRAGVALIGGRAVVEASGGVTLETVAAIAATGVDVISVGALTHSVRALDLGLDIALRA